MRSFAYILALTGLALFAISTVSSQAESLPSEHNAQDKTFGTGLNKRQGCPCDPSDLDCEEYYGC